MRAAKFLLLAFPAAATTVDHEALFSHRGPVENLRKAVDAVAAAKVAKAKHAAIAPALKAADHAVKLEVKAIAVKPEANATTKPILKAKAVEEKKLAGAPPAPKALEHAVKPEAKVTTKPVLKAASVEENKVAATAPAPKAAEHAVKAEAKATTKPGLKAKTVEEKKLAAAPPAPKVVEHAVKPEEKATKPVLKAKPVEEKKLAVALPAPKAAEHAVKHEAKAVSVEEKKLAATAPAPKAVEHAVKAGAKATTKPVLKAKAVDEKHDISATIVKAAGHALSAEKPKTNATTNPVVAQAKLAASKITEHAFAAGKPAVKDIPELTQPMKLKSPEHGFHGPKVEHVDMETATSDWHPHEEPKAKEAEPAAAVLAAKVAENRREKPMPGTEQLVEPMPLKAQEQGFQGDKVQHKGMLTATSDWGKEFHYEESPPTQAPAPYVPELALPPLPTVPSRSGAGRVATLGSLVAVAIAAVLML